MKPVSEYKKITTKCGRQFNKDLLTIIAFTLPNFKSNNASYLIYRSIYNEYIRCINFYDAAKDYMTINCEIIPEKEAVVYLQSGKTQRA